MDDFQRYLDSFSQIKGLRINSVRRMDDGGCVVSADTSQNKYTYRIHDESLTRQLLALTLPCEVPWETIPWRYQTSGYAHNH